MNILQIEDVFKSFGNFTALDHVTINVPKGVIYGLLGPNGAGKTTLIRIITTIIRADSGKVILDGEKLNSSHPHQIGYMPEERGLYKKMKVGDQLTYLARLKGLSAKEAKREINFWFEKFDIQDWWNKKVEELSKGMQQKIQFISTVVHQPKLLILDEPFTGLDPINTNLIKEEISRMNAAGTSIIFSTHRMEQVEEICEYITLINRGKNVLEGKVADVKQQFKENQFRIEYQGALPADLQAVDDANDAFEIQSKTGGELIVKVAEENASNELLNHLLKNGVHINSFNEILPSLNQIFIKQAGQTNE